MNRRECENLVISLVTANIIDSYQFIKINNFKNLHSYVIDQIRKFVTNVLKFSFFCLKTDLKEFYWNKEYLQNPIPCEIERSQGRF